jgi:NAD(P)H-dependent FMN reductase
MRIRLRRGYGRQVADCRLQQGEGSISDKIEMSANTERPLFIPIILGTTRQGRKSEHVAHFVFEQTKKRADVQTELIDVRELPMRLDDAGEQMKDPAFSATIERCDGIILVVPEYNHGYPGLLKHALDMNLKEYIHKAVGICGVSAGRLAARGDRGAPASHARAGLGHHLRGRQFGKVGTLFDEQGNLIDQNYVGRVDKFLNELIWMARVLRHGRERSRRSDAVAFWVLAQRHRDCYLHRCRYVSYASADRRSLRISPGRTSHAE